MPIMDGMLSPAPAARPTPTRFSSPWEISSTMATLVSPFSPSYKKTVGLFDWWLIKANSAFKGKNMAVSGFTTRQHATRIFCSAPIVKRHDAYTLEAADGITVLLQGNINISRMQESFFPLEACNRFLIGFPDNWNRYAEEYFKESSSTATNFSLDETSKDSTNRTGSAFPTHLFEFPMSKVLNLLSLYGDKSTTNFSDHLKMFFTSISSDSEMKKSSSSHVDDNCKQDVEKNGRNISGSAVSAEPHDSKTACCGHIECSNLDGTKGITVKKSSLINMNVGRNSTLNSQLSNGLDASQFSSILGEENVGNKRMSGGTEEHSPIVQENNSPTIGICTRSGRTLCSPSSYCSSIRSNDKASSYLSKMKAREVSEEYEAATMMETCNEKPSKEKWFASASGDHSSTLNGHQDLSIASDGCSSHLPVKLLCTGPLKCSNQMPPASGRATTKELIKQNGLLVNHVVVENTPSKSGRPKSSSECSIQSNSPVFAQSNKVKTTKLSGKNMMKKKNNLDSKEPAVLSREPRKNKELHMNQKRKLSIPTAYVYQSPLTSDKAERFSMASPELLNLRRSRSGRLIVPPLDNGSQQIVYDADGSIMGITNVDMLSSFSRGSMSEPPKRRKML